MLELFDVAASARAAPDEDADQRPRRQAHRREDRERALETLQRSFDLARVRRRPHRADAHAVLLDRRRDVERVLAGHGAAPESRYRATLGGGADLGTVGQ